MKVAGNVYEYWIHKYKYSSEHKRKQFKRLLKAGKVTKVINKEYNLSPHYVYKSEIPIKLCKG